MVAAQSATSPYCCRRCESIAIDRLPASQQLTAHTFVTCMTCGNKRCPRAEQHDIVCSGSNEPIAPDRFHSPIPGGTYCENCGRLKHAHVDDHCVTKPLRSRAKRDDESVGAALDRALSLLASVVRLVPESAFAWPVEQHALNDANAFLEQHRKAGR